MRCVIVVINYCILNTKVAYGDENINLAVLRAGLDYTSRSVGSQFIYIHTHTHTHTYIYIYKPRITFSATVA